MDPNTDIQLHQQLLLRIGNGEESAFSELYDLLVNPLAALAYRILGDPAEVEEVIQDVFTTIWRKASTYDPTLSRPFSWMVVITRRLCWNRLRSRGRHCRKLDALKEAGAGPVIPLSEALPDSEAENAEIREAVRLRLHAFPELKEKVIEMSLFDGLTHEEIAEGLQLPLGTVKTWIRRGLLKIKEELKVEV